MSRDPEVMLPSTAARKRLAAERKEAQAARLRSEAADLERHWRDYQTRSRSDDDGGER